MRAIRAVNSGEAIFGPSIGQRLMQYFAIQRAPAPPTIFPQLTDREREILAMIVQGLNNADIADRLEVSLKTVRNHVSNIFSKLQVADRSGQPGTSGRPAHVIRLDVRPWHKEHAVRVSRLSLSRPSLAGSMPSSARAREAGLSPRQAGSS